VLHDPPGQQHRLGGKKRVQAEVGGTCVEKPQHGLGLPALNLWGREPLRPAWWGLHEAQAALRRRSRRCPAQITSSILANRSLLAQESRQGRYSLRSATAEAFTSRPATRAATCSTKSMSDSASNSSALGPAGGGEGIVGLLMGDSTTKGGRVTSASATASTSNDPAVTI
jgi:hypothetical protein